MLATIEPATATAAATRPHAPFDSCGDYPIISVSIRSLQHAEFDACQIRRSIRRVVVTDHSTSLNSNGSSLPTSTTTSGLTTASQLLTIATSCGGSTTWSELSPPWSSAEWRLNPGEMRRPTTTSKEPESVSSWKSPALKAKLVVSSSWKSRASGVRQSKSSSLKIAVLVDNFNCRHRLNFQRKFSAFSFSLVLDLRKSKFKKN